MQPTNEKFRSVVKVKMQALEHVLVKRQKQPALDTPRFHEVQRSRIVHARASP